MTMSEYVPGAIAGTVKFTWYNPTLPGVRPAKDTGALCVPIVDVTLPVT